MPPREVHSHDPGLAVARSDCVSSAIGTAQRMARVKLTEAFAKQDLRGKALGRRLSVRPAQKAMPGFIPTLTAHGSKWLVIEPPEGSSTQAASNAFKHIKNS